MRKRTLSKSLHIPDNMICYYMLFTSIVQILDSVEKLKLFLYIIVSVKRRPLWYDVITTLHFSTIHVFTFFIVLSVLTFAVSLYMHPISRFKYRNSQVIFQHDIKGNTQYRVLITCVTDIILRNKCLGCLYHGDILRK